MSIYLLVVALAVAAMVVWNLVPKVRAKLKGLSTVLETVLGAVLYSLDILTKAVEEAQASGYIPDNYMTYVPYLMFGYIFLKRMQTSTKVGK